MAAGMRKGPVLIELDAPPPEGPEAAPPVPDEALAPTAAMQRAAILAAHPPSVLGRWFWRLLAAILTFAISVWAWRFATGLMEAYPLVGWFAVLLFGLFVLVCFAIALREWAAFARLRRLDVLHREADRVLAAGDLSGARRVAGAVAELYAAREELRWGRDRLKARQDEVFDADGLLGLVETELLAPLDQAARREIEAAARQVAAVTALVPLALADVATALAANLRMIRRIAELYGGRSGTFGSWRLVRTVFTHLVATGAVAVGDDVISSVAGRGLLSKVSRRFGEGVINAALTARVGVAAMEVCRPLPFRAAARPSVTALLQRAVSGLFQADRG